MIIIGDIHTQNNFSRRVLYLALIACCNHVLQVHRFTERLVPLIETGFKIMRIYVKLLALAERG